MALAYQLVLMRFIGGLFFNLYDRYFPDLAGVLLAVTLYQIFKKRVRLGVRTARLFYLDKKELIMSARSRRTLAVAGVILIVLLMLPLARRTIRSEAILRPAGVIHVDAPGDGVIERVLVSEGDNVGQAPSSCGSSTRPRRPSRRGSGRRVRGWRAARAPRGRPATPGPSPKPKGCAPRRPRGSRWPSSSRIRLSIKSPIVGRVLTARPADLVGDFVKAGRPLLEVA